MWKSEWWSDSFFHFYVSMRWRTFTFCCSAWNFCMVQTWHVAHYSITNNRTPRHLMLFRNVSCDDQSSHKNDYWPTNQFAVICTAHWISTFHSTFSTNLPSIGGNFICNTQDVLIWRVLTVYIFFLFSSFICWTH